VLSSAAFLPEELPAASPAACHKALALEPLAQRVRARLERLHARCPHEAGAEGGARCGGEGEMSGGAAPKGECRCGTEGAGGAGGGAGAWGGEGAVWLQMPHHGLGGNMHMIAIALTHALAHERPLGPVLRSLPRRAAPRAGRLADAPAAGGAGLVGSFLYAAHEGCDGNGSNSGLGCYYRSHAAACPALLRADAAGLRGEVLREEQPHWIWAAREPGPRRSDSAPPAAPLACPGSPASPDSHLPALDALCARRRPGHVENAGDNAPGEVLAAGGGLLWWRAQVETFPARAPRPSAPVQAQAVVR
jgi:hypothetical protein